MIYGHDLGGGGSRVHSHRGKSLNQGLQDLDERLEA